MFSIDWSSLTDLNFWLNTKPGVLSRNFEILFLAIIFLGFGMWLAAIIIHRKLAKTRHKNEIILSDRLGKMFLSLFIVFSFLFFFRNEGIPFLGGRFWILLWLIWALIWLGAILWQYFRWLPPEAKAINIEKKNDKYTQYIK